MNCIACGKETNNLYANNPCCNTEECEKVVDDIELQWIWINESDE